MLWLPKFVKAGLQSGSIMAVADLCTQFGLEHQHKQGHDDRTRTRTWDQRRTARWATAGLFLHGPYFFHAFSRVDRYLGAATSFSVVLKKTAIAQFVVFPPYLILLFSYLGLLEGHNNITQKVQQRVPEAFISGCVFWPLVNGVNFWLVPSTLRVPYLATTGGIWNAYLSWANARGSCGEDDDGTERVTQET